LVLLAAGIVGGAPPAQKAPAADPGKLIVHEWGTFLSVQGSDGKTLGGMVDSDEPLPSFVESRGIAGWKRSLFRQKGETPVTYFYTDRPRAVQVQVRMPKGVLTHWYPAVCGFGPDVKGSTAPANSYLDWCTVHLTPDTDTFAKDMADHGHVLVATKKGQVFTGLKVSHTAKELVLRDAGARDIHIANKDIEEIALDKGKAEPPAGLPKVGPDLAWRFARQTDSALVRVAAVDQEGNPHNQFEKFLFYRGLGTFGLPLEVRSTSGCKAGLTLTFHNTDPQPLRSLFALSVEKDRIQFAPVGDLAGKATREVVANAAFSAPLPLPEGVAQVKRAVAEALVAAGLYPKEAQAMVNTWERSYFRTEGVRVLYVMPRELVDAVIPIEIKPAPDQLVRVMLGRVEVLTPAHEEQIERWVAQLGSDDFATRQAASKALARLGRIGEPALRRVKAATTDAEVRKRAAELIAKFDAMK
jgi:hypothetical protein